jgi:cell wall-associated NlpC family hydrolase
MRETVTGSREHRRFRSRLSGVLASRAAILLLVLAVAFATATVAHAIDSAAPADTGSHFRVTGTDGAALRLRESPGLNSPILARLPEGALVTLAAGAATEKDGERWLPVKLDQADEDIVGWSAARYLVRAVPLSPVARPLGPDSSFGERVAAGAEKYLGQPYVWGGNKPGGFDCSGFVQWVYAQSGLRMPRLISDQLSQGRNVQMGALQAGDLVAFRDTYKPGLSHAGIAVSPSRFVHAADEAHGVTVSNVLDNYWKPRFYAAVRLRS